MGTARRENGDAAAARGQGRQAARASRRDRRQSRRHPAQSRRPAASAVAVVGIVGVVVGTGAAAAADGDGWRRRRRRFGGATLLRVHRTRRAQHLEGDRDQSQPIGRTGRPRADAQSQPKGRPPFREFSLSYLISVGVSEGTVDLSLDSC